MSGVAKILKRVVCRSGSILSPLSFKDSGPGQGPGKPGFAHRARVARQKNHRRFR